MSSKFVKYINPKLKHRVKSFQLEPTCFPGISNSFLSPVSPLKKPVFCS